MTSERLIALSRSSQHHRAYPTLQAKHSGLKVVLKGILKNWNNHWNHCNSCDGGYLKMSFSAHGMNSKTMHGEESLICTLIDELSSPEAAVLHQLKDDWRFSGPGHPRYYNPSVCGEIRGQVVNHFPVKPGPTDEQRTRLCCRDFKKQRLQRPMGLSELARKIWNESSSTCISLILSEINTIWRILVASWSTNFAVRKKLNYRFAEGAV